MVPAVEDWLERERDQIALWLPVALGAGIAAWFAIPLREGWIALMLASAGLALIFLLAGRAGGRAARHLGIACLLVGLGVALIWWRAERVSAPRLERPIVTRFRAEVVTIEDRPAEARWRLLLRVPEGQGVPPRIRLNADSRHVSDAIQPGSLISVRARLAPPPGAALPGAYDFARVAWFSGLGATGRTLDPVTVVAPARRNALASWLAETRFRLTRHVHASLPGSEGGIAAALVTGDQGAIAPDDAAAMRMSGLAHLLSISGLHVGVVVAGAMLVMMRLLALSPRLALHLPLPLLAAGAAAVSGVAYTLLAGAEVPTIRSCVASLLVLVALAIGREPLSLRLVAAGALVVLILWPEALAGPSFQLSFAAVTALVALHEMPWVRDFVARRDESVSRRIGRAMVAMVLTGLVVELALAPIALFHFHRTGIYGALANMIAIPLTSAVIMPVEALALLADVVNAGTPFWWLLGKTLAMLLLLARTVANWPGAVTMVPEMPPAAFAMAMGGSLWLGLWRTASIRLNGLVFVCAGVAWAMLLPSPDLLVTADGRHVAIRTNRGMALLRDRSGDYVRKTIGEISGLDETLALDSQPFAKCSPDFCATMLKGGGRRYRLLLARSGYAVPWQALISACGAADIVISDRRLPARCRPRWLRIDPLLLARTGGLVISLAGQRIVTGRVPVDDHPWWRASAPRHVRGDGGQREGDGLAVAREGEPDSLQLMARDLGRDHARFRMMKAHSAAQRRACAGFDEGTGTRNLAQCGRRGTLRHENAHPAAPPT